ncbi:MAG: hypothetical protein E4H14_12520 [Candidatus Thorarchaeota archaeon]|nr:MAG: hypothetical protein E4H14_12520 [Candidatus Thorarchaeota archaeon]
MSENATITVEFMDEAWADIRGYTANMWQVAALCLTVVILSVNVFVTTLGTEATLLSFAWIPVITFALCFVLITVYTIQWFRYATVQRVVFLLKVEEKLKKSAPEAVVSLRDIYGVDWGPLRVVLLFFYGLAIVLLSIIEIALVWMGVILHPLFHIIAAAGVIVSAFWVFLPLYRQYQGILVKEEDAWTLSDVTKFSWSGEHFPVLKDIALLIIEMHKDTVRGKRVNYFTRTREYVETSHGARLSESTVRGLYQEGGPISKLGLDPKAIEWKKRKDQQKALDELEKIADKITKMETMP